MKRIICLILALSSTTHANQLPFTGPIDLGAEWIHEDKSILNYITNQTGSEPNVETILYQPMNVHEVDGNTITQNSEQEMIDYYANYITEYKFKNTT